MFADMLFEKSSAAYEKHILLIDEDLLEEKTEYCKYYETQGFHVVYYKDDLDYRINIETEVKRNQTKILLIATLENYIPYDVQKCFRLFNVGIAALFPKLNVMAIKQRSDIDFDLLSMAYEHNYEDLSEYEDTQDFIESIVYGKKNVEAYLNVLCVHLFEEVQNAKNYKSWFDIAEKSKDSCTI